jgi:uncharacterized protein with GYD domain
MATYFLFGKYSSEATKGMSSERTGKANKLLQKLGGEIKSIYALLGEKDLVIIATFPGTQQALKASLSISKLTGITFTTSEAIQVEDFDKLISDI